MGCFHKSVCQQKFIFIHWKGSFHRICLLGIRSACSSSASASVVPPISSQFPDTGGYFSSPCSQKKSSILLHPSPIGLLYLWSCLLSLSLEKPSCILSCVALEGFIELFLFLILRILYFNQLKRPISLNTWANQHPQ